MRPFFAFKANKPPHTGIRKGCPYLISLTVCPSVCVCVTNVVFTDCRAFTRLISTNPGSLEAGEYGLTRGTCFFAHRREVVAVAELLWISWCVLGAADFLALFMSLHFQIRGARAVSVDSVKGQRHHLTS